MGEVSVRNLCASLVLTAMVFADTGTVRAAEVDNHNIGKSIQNFSLHDYRGKIHTLEDYRDSKLLVVAFLGNDCPLARLYGPRLEQLSKELGPEGVAIVGIKKSFCSSAEICCRIARPASPHMHKNTA